MLKLLEFFFPPEKKFSSIGQGHTVLGKAVVQSYDYRLQEEGIDFFPMTIPISTQDARVFLSPSEDLSSSCSLGHRALLLTPSSPSPPHLLLRGSAVTPLGKASPEFQK